MPTIRTFTRSRPSRIPPYGEDCFLCSGYVPDSFLLETPDRNDQEYATLVPVRQTVCFAVFSGIGNQSGTHLAARIAAELLRDEIPRIRSLPLNDIGALFKRFRSLLARRLRETSQYDPDLADVDVTMTLAAVRGNQALVQVVNGGCAYVTRNGHVRPIGRGDALISLNEGDRLLLASSGFCIPISDDEITGGMNLESIRQAADRLITLISERGQRRCQTCMILEWSAMERDHPITPRMDKLPLIPPNPEYEKSQPEPQPKPPPYDPWAHFPVWVAYFGLALAVAVGLLIYFGLKNN